MSSTDSRLASLLAAAPPEVRSRMLAQASRLEPGAAAVVGRFFAVIGERREPIDAPTRASFDIAARSEPTLGTLLRTLGRYAPEVGLAGGREAKKAWYGRRPKPPAKPRPAKRDRLAIWPAAWHPYLAQIEALRDEKSSQTVAKYLYWLDRCADGVSALGIEPRIDRWLAHNLLRHFRAAGLREITCKNYLTGLDVLARLADIPQRDRVGVREVLLHAERLARRQGKRKDRRLHELHDAGGYAHVAETAGALREAAQGAPAWSSRAEKSRQTASVLAILINDPARCGDLSSWRLGRELVRRPDGSWTLEYRQRKNGKKRHVGELWPEVCELLDELVCAGRPLRFAQSRYEALIGCNWLTHEAEGRSPKWPSALVKRVIGNPAHDVRTLALDYLRQHDPAIAARIGRVHLGHRHERSQEDYRSLAEGVAASREWRKLRLKIARWRPAKKRRRREPAD